jgi:hypothetical protein
MHHLGMGLFLLLCPEHLLPPLTSPFVTIADMLKAVIVVTTDAISTMIDARPVG